MTLLEGIAIGGYRSFGPQPALIGPLGKLNLIVGQNNSGKSNLLRFLSTQLGECLRVVRGEGALAIDALNDPHRGQGGQASTIGFALRTGGTRHAQLLAKVDGLTAQGHGPHTIQSARRFVESLFHARDYVWLLATGASIGQPHQINLSPASYSLKSVLQDDNTRLEVQRAFTGSSGGGSEDDQLRAIAYQLLPGATPPVTIVPAVRQIGPAAMHTDEAGGRLIERIAQFESPAREHSAMRDRFDAIVRFLRTVLDRPNATLRVPFERNEIIVSLTGDNRDEYPLAAMGAGVEEVIILAAAATSVSEHLVCIEEPELHLHPVLQRQLLAYLANETDNQYIIATHSAHMLDTPGTSVFHLTSTDSGTSVTYADTELSRVALCADLGYRASDLVQANVVVWVEGPSDRIYLNYWLRETDPELIEGIHYSIMFYGGRLLSHVSGGEMTTLVEEFIALRRINQHPAILMDSDRPIANAKLNGTKRRVKKSFDETGGHVWVTRGREIESYIEPNVLAAAIKYIHPDAQPQWLGDKFADPLECRRGRRSGDFAPDKVKVARRVVATDTFEDRFDLRRDCLALARYIREANGI